MATFCFITDLCDNDPRKNILSHGNMITNSLMFTQFIANVNLKMELNEFLKYSCT